MVKFVAHRGFNSTTVANDIYQFLLSGAGTEPGRSSAAFTIDNTFVKWDATGSGFAYDGFDRPADGVIETLAKTDSQDTGEKYYTATGLDVDLGAVRTNPPAELGKILTGNDSLVGSDENDTLGGFAGNDNIKGNDGTDTITGGRGRDTMSGGAKGDIFDYNAANESGKTAATRDKILDFKHNLDTLDFADIDANGGDRGRPGFDFLSRKGAKFSGDGAELRWFQEDNAGQANDRTIIEADLDGNKKADFQIELKGLVGLTKGDLDL
jgi:hypothetical protein